MKIKPVFFKRKILQIGSLYCATIGSIIIGFCISIINTRFLGPSSYGDLKFLQSIFGFTVTFFTLGFFVSGSRLLAYKKYDYWKNNIIGALFIWMVIISFFFSSALFLYSFFQDEIFATDLGKTIRAIAPLLIVYPFNLFLEKILMGENRIFELSLFHLIPKILYVIIALIFNHFFTFSLISAIFINFLGMAFVNLMITKNLKPQFSEIKYSVSLLWKENKTNGFPIYVGLLFGVATGSLGQILVGYYMDNINVGFFSLAMTITMPLGLIPGTIGTSLFKEFANKPNIPSKIILISILISIIALVVFIIIIKPVVVLLYSSDYLPVATFSYYLAVGMIFHGFGDFFTRFLGAHGKGKEMRNSAIIVGIVNVIGYFILIKNWGVMGAVITKIGSSFLYLCLRYNIYLKSIR